MTIFMAFTLSSCKQETKDKINEASEAIVEDTKEVAKEVTEEVKETAEEVADEVSNMTQRIKFATGGNSSRVTGKITGDDYVDYLVNVRKGQSMNVSMSTDNAANYFNIMEPNEEYVAVFNSSTAENQYEGVTEKSGDYRIRVYLMRSAARRGRLRTITLKLLLNNSGF